MPQSFTERHPENLPGWLQRLPENMQSLWESFQSAAPGIPAVGGVMRGAGGAARGFNALSQIGKVSKLSPEIEQGLIAAAKAGKPGAWEQMVQQYTPFVVRIAKKFTKPGGAELDDMVNEGAMSIRRAAESYDPARGDFLNHLGAVLRRDLGEAAYKQGGPMVQVPPQMQRAAARVSRVTEKYRTITGETPQVDELSAMTGIPAEQIRQIQAGLPERVSMVENTTKSSAPSQLPDPSDLLKILNPREQDIVGKIRSGMSSQDIAKEAGISEARVSQILKNAIGKLQSGEGAKRPYPIQGGSGEFPGTSPTAIFNSPQKTPEGNILPPVGDLYREIPFTGQLPTPPAYLTGRPTSVVRATQGASNIPESLSEPTIPVGNAVRKAELQNPANQLQGLQDLFTRLWFGQGRN